MAYQTIDPFTEALVRDYPQHTDAQIQAALASADAAFRSDWGSGPIAQRLKVLTRLSELLIERRDELADAITGDMGKLIGEARREITLCSNIAAYYAQNAERILAPVSYPTKVGEAWVEHHPVGVLVAVEPWNFPIYQLIRVVAPALAVGNSVLMKHASNVPRCAALFEAIVRDAGAPEGACINLYITNEQVSELIGDDRVQGVALTGSERAGSQVASRASQMLKKSTLELGGADVFIVLDDADVAKAAAIGAAARLFNAGQMCTSAKRFIVHERVAEQFMTQFSKAMQKVKPGDPRDEATTLAPLSSRAAVEGLTKQLDTALAHGATLVFGGKPVEQRGFFFEPTLITDIDRDNPAYFEEFFGPVAQLYIVKSDAEAIALANDSHFGLGGALFSSDIPRARGVASKIETGMVFINAATDSLPELPFGGVKRSGFGRELGDLGIMEFVNKKLVVVAA